MVVDSKDVLVFGNANVERFELVAGAPLAKVSLKPERWKLRNDAIVATSINDKIRDRLGDDITL